MYARNVKIKLKPKSVPEFTRILQEEIIPLLRKQRGFQHEISFVAPHRSEAIAISFCDRWEDAANYNHMTYPDVLKLLSQVIRGVPIVESFEVANSTSDDIVANTALAERLQPPELNRNKRISW